MEKQFYTTFFVLAILLELISCQPRAAYAAMITQLDIYVGQIGEKIKELGLDENTMIMFSSDNGTTFNGGVQAAFFNSTGNRLFRICVIASDFSIQK